MRFYRARSWTDALKMKADFGREAVPLNGGTDLMVEINFGRRRPEALIDLASLEELRTWREEDGEVCIGAGTTMARIVAEFRERIPGLAMAARTVGSPQIRNRATLGGNVATASPAGDTLPPLVVLDAVVEVESVRGARSVRMTDFLVGPKKSTLAADELIRSIRVPATAGRQQFAKVGTRNAMVIAVCSVALLLDPAHRKVRVCVGSAAPIPVAAPDAETYLSTVMDQRSLWTAARDLDTDVVDHFGDLVAASTSPIDDVRGSADYRRHAVAVLARRTLRWAWHEYRSAA
jgi:CO/xanthine dehydrogenase FAD-binding subunit